MENKKAKKQKTKNKESSNNEKGKKKYHKQILLPILAIIILAIVLFAPSQKTNKYSETRNLMGTFMTITVYHDNQDEAYFAINETFNEAKRIENLLSHTIESSDVYKLNRDKIIEYPSWELIENIMIANNIYQQSHGHFDITVQPILELYEHSFKDLGRAPTDDEINALLDSNKEELEKYSYEELGRAPTDDELHDLLSANQGRITMNKTAIKIGENQKITLGGIAKGYIVDKSIEALKFYNISSALVNAGGDLKTLGTKPNNKSWVIALSNPDNKKESIVTIPINNMSVVTSGNYERYFDDNKEFHHIVNPWTGKSADEIISVTVISEHAVLADAVSTAIFVLGEKEGQKFTNLFDNTESLIITKDKRILESNGWNSTINIE